MSTLEQRLSDGVARVLPMGQAIFDDLARNTADPAGGVTRAPYGDGEEYAHRLLTKTARDLNLELATDPSGNLYMTLPGRDRKAPAWIVGSHLDSVPKGGNYDGAAGVVAGVVAIGALRSAELAPAQDVTVMAIRSEETGSWFVGRNGGHLGSRMALGLLRPAELDDAMRIDSGRTLAEHMKECGFDPDFVRGKAAYLKRERMKGYLELHIEQGPLLENLDMPIGIVTGIRGNSRLNDARCVGAYNHGGATPQEMRQDAVIATSDFIVEVDRKWREMSDAKRDLIFTFGKLATDAKLHSLSKVPGEVRFSLDLRSTDSSVLAMMREFVSTKSQEVAQRRRVQFELGAFSVSEPTVLDENLRRQLHAGCQALGLPTMDIASGGGHDAQEFKKVGVPSAMIFVRNPHGSHNAKEDMAMDDFALGVRLMAWTLATH